MKLLAIDFSTERKSVCVASGREILSTETVDDRRAGAMGLIERALKAAGIARDEIECLAVGIGPGSYTGIRSSIAIAQGWQLGTGVKLCSVSSVDILAGSADVEGEFVVAVDAQRGEFYAAGYRRLESALTATGELRIVTVEELFSMAGGDLPIVGPDIRRFDGRGIEVFPDAAVLARKAAEEGSYVEGADLEPIYLRALEFRKAPPARIID